MAHYAEIDENNVVKRVIVIDQDVLNTGLFGDQKNWIQTSYNTYAGKHLLGGTPLRKNYAAIGYIYDQGRDAFIPPKPFASWSLDEDSCQWQPPVSMPDDGKNYNWSEDTQSWIELVSDN